MLPYGTPNHSQLWCSLDSNQSVCSNTSSTEIQSLRPLHHSGALTQNLNLFHLHPEQIAGEQHDVLMLNFKVRKRAETKGHKKGQRFYLKTLNWVWNSDQIYSLTQTQTQAGMSVHTPTQMQGIRYPQGYSIGPTRSLSSWEALQGCCTMVTLAVQKYIFPFYT
jgi:hypothetical protein